MMISLDFKNINQLGNYIVTKNRNNPQRGRVYDLYALAPAVYNYSGGGNLQPTIIVRVIKKEDYEDM